MSKSVDVPVSPFLTLYTVPLGHSDLTGLICLDPTFAVQSERDSADINFIVKQFGVSHEIPYGTSVPEYADYSDIPNDFHAAMAFVDDSRESFMQFPASIRTRFDNDPGLFLDFVSNPVNYPEAESLGLVPSKAPASPSGDVFPPDGGEGANKSV